MDEKGREGGRGEGARTCLALSREGLERERERERESDGPIVLCSHVLSHLHWTSMWDPRCYGDDEREGK